ncbi:hypothetical protein JCM18902_2839 [Psychrobacter sp. JCM 18902]|uniref:DUF1176 domain-containing protein n=1 Tax=Psychrobacter sp. JCM 18902 TaxID=1298607 RepID=UPI000434065A|nr:DUF1176 domain-containing protein [Psychrobacter sp. JCM 18902]GAF59946.1 hypothetical protein JCM18902_2839 [Psychrobacter sp. JCM 18902]
MKKLTILLSAMMGLLPLTSISAHAAYGTPFEGWGFVQDDWQVVCDNTLTCRAAGYADESMFDTPASILLTVIPKKALPIAQIQFLSETSDKTYHSVELWLNGKNQGMLQPDADGSAYDLTAKQTQQLLSHSRQNTKIEIRAGDENWSISDRGMSAVLLKLDEVQGRVGTPLALVSKNNPNRQTPKAAKPVPVIKQAYAYSEKHKKPLDAKTLAYLQANINKWVDIDAKELIGSEDDMGDCELVNPKNDAYQRMQEYGADRLAWTFTPVDATHTLASHLCWQGAYNESYGYWLIDNANPRSSQLITTAGNDYSDGEIWAVHKDRGIGDCWNHAIWVWNGQTFAKSEDSSSGMCRGFAGGAWDLPTYVSEVVKNDSKAQ